MVATVRALPDGSGQPAEAGKEGLLTRLVARGAAALERSPWVPLALFLGMGGLLVVFTWQQDVYEWFLFEGRVLLSGGNPYEPLNQLAIEKYGQTGRYGYPPLALPFFAAAAWVTDAIGFPFHVLLGLECLAVFALGVRGLQRFWPDPRLAYLWLLNPLVFVVGLSWKFLPDLLMVTFFLLAVAHARRPSRGGLFLGLAALSKQIVWILVPLFLVGLYLVHARSHGRSRAWRALLTTVAAAGLVISVALAFVAYPFTPAALSALYHGLFDPVGGAPAFSFYSPLIATGLFPSLLASVVSLWLVIGWMLYAGARFATSPSGQDGASGTASLARFLAWAALPIPLLSQRLAEPHFWLLQLSLLAMALAVARPTRRPALGLLYAVVAIATFLFFVAQMGFRHLAFHFDPWPGYAETTLLGLNWWHWLWVVAYASLAVVAWAFLTVFPRGGRVPTSPWDGGSRRSRLDTLFSTWGRTLFVTLLAALLLSFVELLAWVATL